MLLLGMYIRGISVVVLRTSSKT